MLTVKGPKGTLEHRIHDLVELKREDAGLNFGARSDTTQAKALAGTTRSIVNNMVVGVSDGFEKKLELIGVGYRAQAKGKVLNLTLGFSHPIDYELPEGVTAETPSQTEIVVKGSDKLTMMVESDLCDHIHARVKVENQLAGCQIPNAYLAIGQRRCKPSAICCHIH